MTTGTLGRFFLSALFVMTLSPACKESRPPVGISAPIPDAGGGAGKPVMDAAAKPDARVKVDAPPSPDVAPPAPPPLPAALPQPWKVDNIGRAASKLGSDYLMNPSATYFILKTASLGIGGTEDSFQFVHQTIKGDGEIIARVRNVDFTGPLAAAGLMVRASADPKAENVFIAVGAGGIGQVQARTSAGGDTAKETKDRANIKVGTYMRLTRVGDTFTAYRGDRKVWTEMGTFTVKMPAEALYGIAATSANPDPEIVGQNEFDYIRINNFVADKALTDLYVEDLGLVGSSVLFEGGAAGAATVKTFGNPWSSTQEFASYTFREVKGDHRMTLRVRSIEDTHAAARVAIMYRNSNVTTVSRSHAHAAVSLTVGQGAEFQHRTANNGATMRAPADATLKAPVWLRLERIGNKFTGSYSMDGKDGSWKELGSAEFMLGDMSLGFAVNSNTGAKVGTAVIDNISYLPLGTPVSDGGVSGAGADR